MTRAVPGMHSPCFVMDLRSANNTLHHTHFYQKVLIFSGLEKNGICCKKGTTFACNEAGMLVGAKFGGWEEQEGRGRHELISQREVSVNRPVLVRLLFLMRALF